ncbi:alkaline shock response membrane anchor protein AmaP [Tissierella praeacuta]|uniref:alkaline shock response membrane anchor protein AmaP n=1 Tax=Tissierella praeacuta TaxID=43131 RepID=UPI00333E6B59
MKILDRLIIALFSLCILILSFCIIVIPFNIPGILSVEGIVDIVRSMSKNYYYTLAGVILFIFSIRIIFSGFSRKESKETYSYLTTRNEYGEIVIYSNTIVGLVQNVVDKFSGISNIKINVNLSEGQVYIELIGDVSAGINIPEVTKELQAMVKEYIEDATGAKVNEVKVKASNVSVPNRVIR